jgi:phospholipase C
MHTRRDFLRRATALTGSAFALGSIPDAIARAMAIDPAPGTTFRDAEHIVILMQENRSFDHSYGALRGVRGFRDPRAHVQPNGNPVWFQTDEKSDTYAPFRLDIKATNATWIGGLPHTWTDQVDARNGGKYDKWLIAKPKEGLPFTLGHYKRDDIPFYYALADAFTVCDQAFCSSLTGTTANRLFLWSGALRANASDFARVMNSDTLPDKEAAWPTFPERLEDAGVAWRIYQNEISFDSGLSDDEAAWLGGFSDNPIEWFTQYNVRFAKSRRAYLPKLLADSPAVIRAHERALQAPGLTSKKRKRLDRELTQLREAFRAGEAEQPVYTDAAWAALPERAKSLHERAFTTNVGDPGYRSLASVSYKDGATTRDVSVPSGDVLHQFRQDVASGALPAVSWLVAPKNFSDHPSSAWYGAWYVSEALDILTKNPEVWKKTVFILCYDENDGYFDHVPPFVAPHPARPETGKCSAGLDTTDEWANVYERESSLGLGYRVPLVVASPWSRGGCVNSQVFDHTSLLQFVERWLAAKGKSVKEANVSEWRRTVCGDLTSVFRPYDGDPLPVPAPLDRDETVKQIYAARARRRPRGGAPIRPSEIGAKTAEVRAFQEPGTRPSCPLPYELTVNAASRGDILALVMEARTDAFGDAAGGTAFNAYSYEPEMTSRSYAVCAGSTLRDELPIANRYMWRVDGPNGFMRQFAGASGDTIDVVVDHQGRQAASGKLEIRLSNRGAASRDVTIRDESYGQSLRRASVPPGESNSIIVDTVATQGWYDFTVHAGEMAYRYAGRVETGKWSITDPAMGRA